MVFHATGNMDDVSTTRSLTSSEFELLYVETRSSSLLIAHLLDVQHSLHEIKQELQATRSEMVVLRENVDSRDAKADFQRSASNESEKQNFVTSEGMDALKKLKEDVLDAFNTVSEESKKDVVNAFKSVAQDTDKMTNQTLSDFRLVMEAMTNQVKSNYVDELKVEIHSLKEKVKKLEIEIEQAKSSYHLLGIPNSRKGYHFPEYLDDGGIFPRNQCDIYSMTHAQITDFASYYDVSFGGKRQHIDYRRSLLKNWIEDRSVYFGSKDEDSN
jgi:polyhydroxyalkanoate synthesis regulator phasin